MSTGRSRRLLPRQSRSWVERSARSYRRPTSRNATRTRLPGSDGRRDGRKRAGSAPTGSDDLVEQLRNASSRRPVAIWVALAAIVTGALIMPWGSALWALPIPGVWSLALRDRDRARRSVVVFYDVNDTAAAQFRAVVDASAHLSTVAGKWRITQSGELGAGYQRKVNAGASSLVSRQPVAIGSRAPRELVTNVQVPTRTAGRTSQLFLPDRVLVRENRNYVDAAYDELEIRTQLPASSNHPVGNCLTRSRLVRRGNTSTKAEDRTAVSRIIRYSPSSIPEKWS
jgi:hypothetical protein